MESSSSANPYVEARPVAGTAAPPPPAKGGGRTGLLLAIFLVLVALLALPYLAQQIAYSITRGEQLARAEVAREYLPELNSTAEAFRWVAQAIEPSVVHIDTVRAVRMDQRGFSVLGSPGYYQTQGQGSGVIVDDQGYILTNYHVIEGAQAIRVKLSDGRTINDVQVVGVDPLTDLAVLQISASGLVAAPWGDSNQLEVGDWVLACGNPYGLDRSVTVGIVSAKERRGVVNGSPYQYFLQTDAAINPGNSGGPLVNLSGQVVGINTAILGDSYRGISFAIPSEIAEEVYHRILEQGDVARGWIGVALNSLDEEKAVALGLDSTAVGALVVQVGRGTPAEAAGLQPGDVIISWDGEPITEPHDLIFAVGASQIGKSYPIQVIRDGEQLELTIGVAEAPTDIPR